MSSLAQKAAEITSIALKVKPVKVPTENLQESVETQTNSLIMEHAKTIIGRVGGTVKQSGKPVEINESGVSKVAGVLNHVGYNYLVEAEQKEQQEIESHKQAVDTKKLLSRKLKSGDIETIPGKELTYDELHGVLSDLSKKIKPNQPTAKEHKLELDIAKTALHQANVQGDKKVSATHARLVGAALAGEATVNPETRKVVLAKQLRENTQEQVTPSLEESVKSGEFHKWVGKELSESLTDADLKSGIRAGGMIAEMAKFIRDNKAELLESKSTQEPIQESSDFESCMKYILEQAQVEDVTSLTEENQKLLLYLANRLYQEKQSTK